MRKFLVRLIDQTNHVAGSICAVLCVIVVVLIGALVLARHSLGEGSVAAQDLSQWLAAALVLLSFGYALKTQSHVRIDIFSSRWTERRRARVEIAGVLIFLLPFCAFIVYSSWDYVAASVNARETSASTGTLPGLYLVKALIPVGAALLALQAIAEVLRVWSQAFAVKPEK